MMAGSSMGLGKSSLLVINERESVQLQFHAEHFTEELFVEMGRVSLAILVTPRMCSSS